MAAQFARLNVVVEIDEAHDQKAPVFRSNWSAVLLFVESETQWRTAGTMAGIFYTGFDYVAVEVVRRHLGLSEDAFAGLKVMEAEALKILNERD